jgi:AcrR family transcriptional regulator
MRQVRTSVARQKKSQRRTQDERSAETRQKLIQAAISTICDLGLSAATTTVIAQRAGLTRGALQYHFKSRFTLLSAVIDRLSAVISSEMSLLANTLPKRAHSLESRLDETIRAYSKIYNSHTFLAVLIIFLGVKNDSRQHVPLQTHMQAFYRLNDDLWLELVRGSHLTTAELIASRRVLFGALRGLAIGRILGTQPDDTRAEYALMKRMFVGLLGKWAV